MENKNEIVEVVEEKSMTPQPTNQFNRIDMENPSTILEYGQDVFTKMEKVIEDATRNFKQDSLPDVSFEERIAMLSGLGDKLDDVEENRYNKTNNKLGFLRRLFKKEESKKNLSYNVVYEEYSQNVNVVVDDVNKMYESSKSDFQLFNTFIKNIKPYVDILQEVYEFGMLDKANYEVEVLLAEQKYQENPESLDLKREAIIKRQTLDILCDKLYSIQKGKAAVNEVIIQWNMRQINAMKQLQSYQSFLSLDKSVLKLNGTALVGAKKQKEEVEKLGHLVDGVNLALLEGPKELNEVISSVNEVTKDGNIKIETIAQIDQYLQQGVELLKQGAVEKKAFVEASAKQLETIEQHFKEFNLEVKEQMLLDAYKAPSFSTASSGVKVKQKTGRKSLKNKF